MGTPWLGGTLTLRTLYPLVIADIAIEHGHINSGFTQLEDGGSFHSYVSLPAGMLFDLVDQGRAEMV
jgi:hypothetical protein